MQLKNPAINVLINGLRDMSENLIELITKAKENVLTATKHCASTANQTLNKKWLDLSERITSCFAQMTANSNNELVSN